MQVFKLFNIWPKYLINSRRDQKKIAFDTSTHIDNSIIVQSSWQSWLRHSKVNLIFPVQHLFQTIIRQLFHFSLFIILQHNNQPLMPTMCWPSPAHQLSWFGNCWLVSNPLKSHENGGENTNNLIQNKVTFFFFNFYISTSQYMWLKKHNAAGYRKHKMDFHVANAVLNYHSLKKTIYLFQKYAYQD